MDWETKVGSDQNFEGLPHCESGLPDIQEVQFRVNSELQASERSRVSLLVRGLCGTGAAGSA